MKVTMMDLKEQAHDLRFCNCNANSLGGFTCRSELLRVRGLFESLTLIMSSSESDS